MAAVLACSPAPALPEEVLLGKVRREAVLEVSPAWRAEYDAYAPAAEDVKALSAAPWSARLDVYLGSWCGGSRVGVPRLLLSVRGHEIGRIVETPQTTLEHDLALLIRKAAGAGPS